MTATRITGWRDRREVWAVTIGGVEHRVEIGESFLKVEIYVDGALVCETRKRYTFAGELRQEIDVAGTRLVVYRTRSTARFKVATADVADEEIAGGHRGAVGGLAATAAIMSGFYLWRTSSLRSTAATIATFVFLAILVVSLVVFTRSQRR